MEIWKLSKGFNELEVSNLGRVRYTDTKIILKIRISLNAAYVSFRIKGEQYGRYVKIMIAKVFLSKSDCKHIICKDGNTLNVAANNLEYRSNLKSYELKAKNKRERDDKWIEEILEKERINDIKIGFKRKRL